MITGYQVFKPQRLLAQLGESPTPENCPGCYKVNRVKFDKMFMVFFLSSWLRKCLSVFIILCISQIAIASNSNPCCRAMGMGMVQATAEMAMLLTAAAMVKMAAAA